MKRMVGCYVCAWDTFGKRVNVCHAKLTWLAKPTYLLQLPQQRQQSHLDGRSKRERQSVPCTFPRKKQRSFFLSRGRSLSYVALTCILSDIS
jgi:hypothetical protein